MRQFFHDSLLDEHRIAHRAVLSLGQTGLRTGGGNGGVNDWSVPRGRDLRHIGFRVTAGTVSALAAVFGAGGGLVLGKIHSIVIISHASFGSTLLRLEYQHPSGTISKSSFNFFSFIT